MRMITKRNFFSIAIMMFILLFLFQFVTVLRDRQNTYDVNAYYVKRKSDGKNVWKQKKINHKLVKSLEGDYLLFIGKGKNGMKTSVSRWCSYRRWNIVQYKNLKEFQKHLKNLPRMIVFESEKYACGKKCIAQLKKLGEQGVIIVFGSVEDPQVIRTHPQLQKFLGITNIKEDHVKMTGVKLFKGLLLGGETVYDTPKDKDQKKRQNLQLNVPWYQVGSGTKTYMLGLLDKRKYGTKIKNEELPTIIWRRGIKGGSVFAVVGNYMKDSTALGLLDGMVTEASGYNIYPVVNARNLSLIGFPFLADENNDEMMRLYSQSAIGISRDSMWPSLISIIEKSKMKMTCFLQPQSDYEDHKKPYKKDFIFYLKQMREQNAEAGLSLQYRKAPSLIEKLNQDESFFRNVGSSYRYGVVYKEEKNLGEFQGLLNTKLLKQVGSIVCEPTEKRPILSYYTGSVTLQVATSDGVDYKFRDDIQMRSVQSCLGYTNIMLNMQDIFWPRNSKDRWHLVQKYFSSNLLTYWKPFQAFDSTTLSESNQRTRTFLNLKYHQSRTGQMITLKTSEKDSWFLLRTHGENISKIKGGTQSKVEEDVYLIHAQEDTVRIKMKEEKLGSS